MDWMKEEYQPSELDEEFHLMTNECYCCHLAVVFTDGLCWTCWRDREYFKEQNRVSEGD
jgi:predicted amidophosphoribosyltransferase